MNKKDLNYVSPTAMVKEMQTEGVLCMSFMQLKEFQHEAWNESDLDW